MSDVPGISCSEVLLVSDVLGISCSGSWCRMSYPLFRGVLGVGSRGRQLVWMYLVDVLGISFFMVSLVSAVLGISFFTVSLVSDLMGISCSGCPSCRMSILGVLGVGCPGCPLFWVFSVSDGLCIRYPGCHLSCTLGVLSEWMTFKMGAVTIHAQSCVSWILRLGGPSTN